MAFDNMDYDFDEQDPIMGYDETEEEPVSPSGGGFDLSGLLDPIVSNPLYLGVGALVLGLLIGLVFAWVVWPVQYVDAAPADLHQEFQLDYMQMVVDSFTLVPDGPLARRRFDALGESGPDALSTLIEQTSGDPVLGPRVNLFAQSYNAAGSGGQPADSGVPTDAAATPGADGETPVRSTSSLLLMACGVVGVVVLGLGAFYFLRMRNREPVGKTAAMRAQEFSRQAEQTDYSENPPIAQWMTTYLVGDDLFDDSFSIDSMNGEFLGECGVGIADTIGVGEPKRVSAFEVWLFDKNDIQTVTNVLLSEHAYGDEMILNRLRAKGEPYLALLGGEIELITKTLRMVVRVMDMDYGTGHLPENSFFQRITLELAVWEL
ncbi:MAG TPA: hypothetical protein VJ965_09240 [Anaerolineales bacterium]|nr:hypothetical protein [Anaerolineales bacterium]